MLDSKTEGMHSWPGSFCGCRNNPIPVGGGGETKGTTLTNDRDDVNPDRKGPLSGATEKLSKHIVPIQFPLPVPTGSETKSPLGSPGPSTSSKEC